VIRKIFSWAGDKFQGNSTLSHQLPEVASIVRPRADARGVSAKDAVIAWTPVKNVAAYIVELEQDRLKTDRNFNPTIRPFALRFYPVRSSTRRGRLAMQLHVGIIGATGFIGTLYRREIRESGNDANIVALCARRQDRLQAAGKEDGAQVVTDDWRKIVDHPDVNFVMVLTPDALHYEAMMACAEKRKHVFCEKPIGVNAREAWQMWNTYQGTGLAHFVPFWTRYVDSFARARQIVSEGTLGTVRAVVYRWHNPRPAAMPFTWRDDAQLSSAGTIADVGSDAYDTVCWILNDEARRVLAHADVITPAKPDLGDIDLNEALQWGGAHDASESSPTRKGTAFDYGAVAAEFASGAVAVFVLSHAPVLRKGLAPELELHGTEASLAVDRITGALTLVRPDGQPELLETLPHEGFVNRFAKYVFPALRARIDGAGDEYPGLEQGWRVQLFTDAAAASAREGGWVHLAELDEQSRQ